MSVKKFKNFSDAERALWCFNPDKSYYKRVAEAWELADKLSGIKYPRGVFKYHSIEEANKDRFRMEVEFAAKKAGA